MRRPRDGFAEFGGAAPATPGFTAVAPEWLNECRGATVAAPVIPAPESTLGSHPCVALILRSGASRVDDNNSAVQCFQRTATTPLTSCLTPRVHFNVSIGARTSSKEVDRTTAAQHADSKLPRGWLSDRLDRDVHTPTLSERSFIAFTTSWPALALRSSSAPIRAARSNCVGRSPRAITRAPAIFASRTNIKPDRPETNYRDIISGPYLCLLQTADHTSKRLD